MLQGSTLGLNRAFGFSGLLLLAAAVIIYAMSGVTAVLFLPIAIWYPWLMITNWKLAYWLLLAAVPLSIDMGALGTFSSSLPDEPMTWLFLLLLPVLLLYKPRLMQFRALQNPIVFVVGLQAIWVAVAAAYSVDLFLSVKYMMVRIWLLAAFFVFPFFIFKKKEDFVAAFRLLVMPVVATMLIVVPRHALLGFDFMRINDAIGRLYYNHVEYSTIISMLFPTACAAWAAIGRKKPWMRVAFGAVLLLFVVAILLSYARAAILAVAFAGVVALGIRYRFAKLIMPAFYVTVAGTMTFLVHENTFLDFRPDYERTIMHHDLGTHLQATFQGTDMSGMERVYRWIAAVRMSADEPITGYGPNTFVQQYKSYTVPAFRTFVSANDERSTTHNYFLYLLAEQGWPGMLLYALLIFAVLSEAQRTYYRFRDPFYRRCTLGLAMMFAAAFINNCFSELTDTHKVGGLFFLSMSLIAILSYHSRRPGAGHEKIPQLRNLNS